MFTHFRVNGWSCVFIVQIKILLLFLQGKNCNRRNLNLLQGQGIISNTGACTLIATGQLELGVVYSHYFQYKFELPKI